jgi:phage terminase Nu1 subunit (DNA packaging protein)
MLLALPENKKLISTAEAAKILGVSMGRVRQLAQIPVSSGGLESWLAAPTARVFDEAAVRKLAKAKRVTGRPKGGFQAN